MTEITVYDANDTISGNKIYVEENGEGVFLDFGANLHNYDKFYKWPDQPRGIRGIYDFMWQRSRKTTEIERGELTLLKDYELPFKVTPYETDHSVYGSVGYILEGEHTVAYTGDIRLHGARKQKSYEFIEGAKGSDILIIEGTRLTGENIFDSEETVYDSCYRAVDMAEGLVIADFSSRNLERLELFKKVASKTNRQLVITAKDAYLLYVLEICDNIDHLENIGIYRRPMARTPYWESEILNPKKHPITIESGKINSNPEGYILCFSSQDVPNFQYSYPLNYKDHPVINLNHQLSKPILVYLFS